MKHLLTIICFLIFSAALFAQKPAKKTSLPPQVPIANLLDEKQEFQNARSLASLSDRIAALQKFTTDFPKSDSRTHALELIVSTRAEFGDQKLRLGEIQAGIDLFTSAVSDAPVPVSDKLFNEIIVQLPTNLFYRNQRSAANTIATMIEEKIAENANQLIELAAFYLGTENGSEGKRLAEMAIELEPESASGYQTLGFANRLNFDLEGSVAAYSKALEINPDSAVSKRNLAEMKRATGKTDEAITLYRDVIEANPADLSAESGLILSLFDANKRDEAENALAGSIETNPNNFFLFVGAAYWYAAHQEGAKAIDLAEKAIAIEPRYSWAYIALGRGLILQKRPLEAERVLLMARQYGNFPTLNYELATARMAAGFYREAADELKKSFEEKDDLISVNLGGRVLKTGKTFTEILAFERRASLFEPVAADDPVAAGQLKSLLKFSQKIEANEFSETQISEAADEFVNGNDGMKIHRSLFAANRLLEKKVAVSKALELTATAIGKVDSSLDVISPAAAVMADALYESRTIAALRNELLVVPDVPRQTLLRIIRGRIEELTGWALLQQQKPEEAAVRLKQAISILPEKSAWWRSSKWRIGDALELTGDSKDALRAYIEAYDTNAPDLAKRMLIEFVYSKVHGSTEGLDQIIGAKPVFASILPFKTENSNGMLPKDPEVKSNDSSAEVEIIKTSDESLVKSEEAPDNQLNIEENPKSLKLPENIPSVDSSEKETKIVSETSEPKLVEQEKPAEAKTTSPAGQTANPLFESIIISVPKAPKVVVKSPVNKEKTIESMVTEDKDPAKETSDEAKTEEETKAALENSEPKEPVKAESEVKLDQIEDKAPELVEIKEAEKPAAGRPRIVGEAKKESIDGTMQCSLKFAQNTISLLNDGGSLGMFVSFEGFGGDPTKIRASSSSPNDLDIEFQPDINVLSERAFFIFKSISPKTGIFTASFDSNCGKKEITVTIR